MKYREFHPQGITILLRENLYLQRPQNGIYLIFLTHRCQVMIIPLFQSPIERILVFFQMITVLEISIDKV